MGAGKTSVMQALASQYQLPAVDADEYLEQQEQRSIASIFEQDGEDVFRAIEAQCLTKVAHAKPHLIGCGGGVVTRASNRELMRATGVVVYLAVSPEEAAKRVGVDTTRPLFTDPHAAQILLEQRIPLYKEAAHITVNTEGRTAAEVAEEIRRLLVQEGALVATS